VKGATQQQKNPTVNFNIQNTKGSNTAMKCQVKTTDNSIVHKQFPIYCLHLLDFIYLIILMKKENDF